MQLAAFVEQRHGADSQDDEVPARISVIDVTVAMSGGGPGVHSMLVGQVTTCLFVFSCSFLFFLVGI